MATSTTNKKTPIKKSTQKSATKPMVKDTKADKVDNAKAETTQANSQKRVRIDLDPNTIVTIRNGYNGTLVYQSKKTGEVFIWDSFGDEQDMELNELKAARNASKAFFINNWFLIDDPDVIEYLGVNQYYDNALSFDEFNELFDKTPSQIEDIISKLSVGQKRSVAYRARALVNDGEIDSNKVIATLEKCLGVSLMER